MLQDSKEHSKNKIKLPIIPTIFCQYIFQDTFDQKRFFTLMVHIIMTFGWNR